MPNNSLTNAPALLFSSPWRSFYVADGLEKVNYQATNQFNINADSLINSVKATLAKKSAANSIIAGCIPFSAQYCANLYCIEKCQFISAPQLIARLQSNSTTLTTNSIVDEQFLFNRADYINAVQMAVSKIKANQLQKVVLAQARQVTFSNPIAINVILGKMLQDNPNNFTFCIPLEQQQYFVGSSPELLIRKYANKIELLPLAGTIAKNNISAQDEQNANWLLASTKNNEEHQFVVADIIEKLSPFVTDISYPKNAELVSTKTLWHLGTKIVGQLKNNLHILELVSLLHPTPALCGSPRTKAADFIAQVESFERQHFAGAVGWCDSNGDGEWAVAIRCAKVGENSATLYAGAGIVAQSNPAEEWNETINKQQVMLNYLLGK